MNEINSGDFARLEERVEQIGKTLDSFIAEVRPMLFARSGDLATVASLQRDITSAHAKIRAQGERLDAVEKRFDRALWMVLGAFAVIQFLWGVVGPAVLRAFGIGG